jgi:hypothetical protein
VAIEHTPQRLPDLRILFDALTVMLNQVSQVSLKFPKRLQEVLILIRVMLKGSGH